MAMFSVNPHRLDPYQGFKFRVIWDGRDVPGIVRVSALRRATDPVEHRSGGDPNHFKVAPGTTRFDPLVLERGLSHDKAFEDWAGLVFSMEGDAAVSLRNYRKDVLIQILNLQGSVAIQYRVLRCWVSEYVALPELDARADCIAIERLVLQHEGWLRDTSVAEPAEH